MKPSSHINNMEQLVQERRRKLGVANCAEGKNPKPRSTRSNLTVLVAEDDLYNYLYLESILEKQTVTVIHARDGVEAVKLLTDNPEISIVLMDIKMPLMDGLDATRRIRKTNPSIPIIAQTAYALSGDRERAMEAGCNDYITKPYDHRSLIELIHRYTQSA